MDCPLMPRCPVHAPTRLLADARIWLATPASLLASSPQEPLVPERIRNLEMTVRSSDVVLVDEADLMQIQFDDRFAPFEVHAYRFLNTTTNNSTNTTFVFYEPFNYTNVGGPVTSNTPIEALCGPSTHALFKRICQTSPRTERSRLP